jgi:carbonic anhydrase
MSQQETTAITISLDSLQVAASSPGETPEEKLKKTSRSPSVTLNDTRFSEPEDFDQIFENNRLFSERKRAEDPLYFERLAASQTPKYLYIGCSDSRVSAQELTGLKTGELFIHRNVANLVLATDMNLLSVIEFSVEYLKVKDIIVMGHSGCGGVEAALNRDLKDRGLIEHWLQNIRDVYRVHQVELDAIQDYEARKARLIELNVKEQALNLYKNNIIQRNQQKTGFPRIHALVYHLRDGRLKRLDVNFKNELDKVKRIYELYRFQRAPNSPNAPKMEDKVVGTDDIKVTDDNKEHK